LYRKNRESFKITPEVDLLEGFEDLELDNSLQSLILVESLLHNNYLKAISKGLTVEQILDKLIPDLCNISRLNY